MHLINTTFDWVGIEAWLVPATVPAAGFLLRKNPWLGLVHWDWTWFSLQEESQPSVPPPCV